MLRALRITAPPQGGRIVLFLAIAASLFMIPHAAEAQSPTDSIYYADVWTPATETVSIHLHGGLFAPIDVNAPSPTLGLRLSKLAGSHLQVGVLTGWTFERKNVTEPVSDLPGTAPERLLARVDAHLVPLMGFLRVNLTEKHWLVPYLGVGAGYEWLTLEANDYRTGLTASATYSNVAWEGWVGLGMRLGSSLRMNGEIFYNGGSLERDVVDPNGDTWTEVVNVDGAGARIGLDIIFQ